MRKVRISEGEYYHVCNRGVGKKIIFREKIDWIRFLFLILHFQSPVTFENMSRYTKKYTTSSSFGLDKPAIDEIIKDRFVTLGSFCLMPNHFHLFVQETKEGGIARYMQRVLNSYTKYYNTKYETSGHLFEGPYRCVHMETNEQLVHVSAYIHKNPKEIATWKDSYWKYPWSSLSDILDENRWPGILDANIITDQFKKLSEYREFIKTSSAKELKEFIDDLA